MKVLLLSLFILFLTFSSKAQCTPDTNVSTADIYGPSAEVGLPLGEVGSVYEAIISLNVPSDTTFQGNTVSLDSMVLLDITGLPPGFTYECDPEPCVFYGNERGCIKISGLTNDPNDAKVWNLVSNFDFLITFAGFPFNFAEEVTDYKIDLTGYPQSINDLQSEDMLFEIDQNPVVLNSMLRMDAPKVGSLSVIIYSLLGTEVFSQNLYNTGNQMELGLGALGLNSGIYFVALRQDAYSRTLRFVVK
jgi:hypothetical protein